jgi:hypothetical protein
MKKNKLLIALAIAACSSAVMADEEISYSFGLKSWNHKLKETVQTSNTSSTIVSFTAKKGDYFLAASFLQPTTYSDSSGYFIRKDADIAFGYSLNSNFSALLGTKRLGVTETSGAPTTVNITYLGANGFTAIGEKTFLFGQLTRSIKLKDSSVPASSGYSSTFSAYELGLGYVLNKNTQVTAGYRTQIFDPNSGVSTVLPGIIFGVNLTP